MTNEERRRALETARRRSLEYAEATAGFGIDPTERMERAALANMWANVAIAMKVGENREADGVVDSDAYITRDEWRSA